MIMIANSLFHFTKNLTTLKKIIKSMGLRASINMEEFLGGNSYMGVPMVCFCDIPLKFIRNHNLRYGAYGIGFKKEWGIKNGISPIFYYHDKDVVLKALRSIRDKNERAQYQLKNLNIYIEDNGITSVIQDIMGYSSQIHDALRDLLFMSKPIRDGNNKRDNYIDREWRFLPSLNSFPLTFHSENSEELRNSLNKNYWNTPDYLKFEVSDIEHIIVKNRDDVKKIISIVLDLEVEEEDKYLLMQKVIDLESIKKDI